MYAYNYVEMARVTGVPMSYLLTRWGEGGGGWLWGRGRGVGYGGGRAWRFAGAF